MSDKRIQELLNKLQELHIETGKVIEAIGEITSKEGDEHKADRKQSPRRGSGGFNPGDPRHIEIRYYFVTDNIKRNNMSVEYCPTDEMTGDFFTKPVQGSLFRRHRSTVMNLSPDVTDGHMLEAQECVESVAGNGAAAKNSEECLTTDGQRTYAEVARGRNLTGADR